MALHAVSSRGEAVGEADGVPPRRYCGGHMSILSIFNPTYSLSGSEVLRSIPEIRRFTRQYLVHEKTVELTATLIINSPQHTPIVLWNGESIWCSPRYDLKAAGALQLGDVLRIQGKALAGRFALTVSIESFKKVGSEPLPKAIPLTCTLIQPGAFDCQFASTRGTVKSIDFEPSVRSKVASASAGGARRRADLHGDEVA